MVNDLGLMTNPLRDVCPEENPHGIDYQDLRVTRSTNQSINQPATSRLRKTKITTSKRKMHLSSDTTNQSTTSNNNQTSDYVLTAEILAERTLDGLFAEHPGELVKTGW